MTVRSVRVGRPVQPVPLLRLESTSCPDGLGELFENLHGGVPTDTGIRDADTLLEAGCSLRGNLLVALIQIGFDHHPHNACLPFSNLIPDDLGHLGLIAVILIGIACTGVSGWV